jgi:hypothetical protein
VIIRRDTSPTDRLFFPLMGLTALAVIGAGFAPTYYLGFWFSAPALAPIVHIHAAAFTAWLLLLLSQTLFIRLGKFRWHRAMGKVAVGLVMLMVITGYMVILGKPRPTAAARAFIFTPMLSLLLFPLFVAAAIHFRRDPATHKRLMLLATMAIATAGIARLMVMLGLDATHYRAYAATYAVLLLPLIIFDLTRLGTLHRSTAWGSALLLVRHALHQVLANTDQWQRIAAWLTPSV